MSAVINWGKVNVPTMGAYVYEDAIRGQLSVDGRTVRFAVPPGDAEALAEELERFARDVRNAANEMEVSS